MTLSELKDFFNNLKKSRVIFGPRELVFENETGTKISVEKLENFDDLVLDSRLPFYSFKKFFVPEAETLFEYKGAELKTSPQPSPYQGEGENKMALFGINILDLKSILLYDQAFERDPYYHQRRQSILVIGHSLIPDLPQNIFEETYEENILEHLSFDIFLGMTGNEFKVFSGSRLGQKTLEEIGCHDYIHIQFSGPVKEGKLDERMLKLKEKLENKHNQKIWDELGRRCIECGKCTIACPTCFCFRIDDRAELGQGPAKQGDQALVCGFRDRCWDSCFFQEFSEVAGPSTGSGQGHKFLSNTAQRIHFWYFHKFARIPREFNFMGCVGCRRCAAVCPVGIDIAEVLKNIETS